MDSYIPVEFSHYTDALRHRYWFQAAAEKFVNSTSWRVNGNLREQVLRLPYDDLVFHYTDAFGSIDDRFLVGSDQTIVAACSSYSIVSSQPFRPVRGIANHRTVNLSFAIAVAYSAVNVERFFAKRWEYRELVHQCNVSDVNELIDFLNRLKD